MAERIALIDYGAGNLRSVANALRAAGAAQVDVTADPALVAAADRIVLPGVGAFGNCIANLTAIPGLVAAMEQRVLREAAPFLGICVGMQLLVDRGEEHGVHQGLGWIGGTVRALQPTDRNARVPHMGWNDVRPVGDSAAASLIEPGEAYFLHGYHVQSADPAHIVATSEHGGPVIAAIGRDTIAGVQFHPEKSQRYGLRLLERFLAWRP